MNWNTNTWACPALSTPLLPYSSNLVDRDGSWSSFALELIHHLLLCKLTTTTTTSSCLWPLNLKTSRLRGVHQLLEYKMEKGVSTLIVPTMMTRLTNGDRTSQFRLPSSRLVLAHCCHGIVRSTLRSVMLLDWFSKNWVAIITVLPFFLERLSGALHDSFASWLSFLFNGVGLVAMGLATWLGGRVRSKFNLFL